MVFLSQGCGTAAVTAQRIHGQIGFLRRSTVEHAEDRSDVNDSFMHRVLFQDRRQNDFASAGQLPENAVSGRQNSADCREVAADDYWCQTDGPSRPDQPEQSGRARG
jgi:hypothetical protein